MTNPNWNEAPEGAERYSAQLGVRWLKKDSGNRVVSVWLPHMQIWAAYADSAEGLRWFNEATPRPTELMPLFKTEQGEEIERLKAELVEATEMALGQAKTLIERDKQIDELKTESKILETTIQELRGTDWAAVNIESQKRIAELEAEALEFRNLHSAFTCALQEASSLASSVSVSRSRKCEIDGETFYMQTDDWCKWAVEEVAPLTRIALNSARLREGEQT